MKIASTILRRLSPLMLVALVAACATPGKTGTSDEVDHKAHHPGTSESTVPSSTPQAGPASNAGQMGMMGSMDIKSMCDMHKNMMSARTPSEREAMMDQRMKSMSPEMRQKHLSMMEEKCK